MKARVGKRTAAPPWAHLQADCLQAVACLLPPRDRCGCQPTQCCNQACMTFACF